MDLAIFDVLIVVCFLFYGYKFLKNPPAFKAKEGLATKRARQSPEAWALAQNLCGKLCLAEGVVLGILTAVEYFVFPDNSAPTWLMYSIFAFELVCIVSLLPIINLTIKKTYGDQGEMLNKGKKSKNSKKK